MRVDSVQILQQSELCWIQALFVDKRLCCAVEVLIVWSVGTLIKTYPLYCYSRMVNMEAIRVGNLAVILVRECFHQTIDYVQLFLRYTPLAIVIAKGNQSLKHVVVIDLH